MGFRVVSRTAGLLREEARPWLFLGGREALFQVGQFADHITKVGESVDNRQGMRKAVEALRTAVPNLFDTRDQFCRRQFFHRPRKGGWFRDDSRALHLLCTLFLLLLHCNI